jgi:adenylyl-sulfate kinase
VVSLPHIVSTNDSLFLITPADREKLIGQRGCVVWLTGFSGAGKSTVAIALEGELHVLGKLCLILDGDRIRKGLTKDLGFSARDRTENVRRVAEVAAILADAAVIVLVALISPMRADRDSARRIVGDARFLEVFVDAPVEECERRDVKDHYRRARSGELPEFTGISAPYEPPERPDLVIETEHWSVSRCVEELLALLRRSGALTAPGAPLEQ